MSGSRSNRIPSRLTIVAGTYDGVLAGWDTVERTKTEADQNDIELKLLRRNDGRHLKLSFAMAAHEGSVRCIDVAGAPLAASEGKKGKEGRKRQRSDADADAGDIADSAAPSPPMPEPGMLLSGGYDETINVYNLQKSSQAGELKTPSDLGSPLCCSFAPPSNSAAAASSSPPTHALVGLTSGKIVLYKKSDWSVQHVLSGHDEGGVQCLAVHPTGRMALTGGRDNKIVLWDLMKGRLAFVHKLPKQAKGGGSSKVSVNHIVWSEDGSRYAFCHGPKITARDVASGEDLLDVAMPSRVNQLAFIGGPEGMFLAAACDDGGLPVLEVGQLEETDDANERRAIMAIEPVDTLVAGDERLKCIKCVEGGSGFLVATANSGGVVSLMDLEGAARMMLTGSNDGGGGEDEESREKGSDESDSDSEGDEDEEVEAAVEILDSVRLGSGARITDLAVWSYGGEDEDEEFGSDEEEQPTPIEKSTDEEEDVAVEEEESHTKKKNKKGDAKENKSVFGNNKIELDAEAVEKARKLVGQAKKHQKKKKKQKAKKEKK